MRRSGVYLAALLLVAVPSTVGPARTLDHDDPLDRVAEALQQGRHWHATRLLRDLDTAGRATPEAAMLAARAASGRRAWREVVESLASASWLDTMAFGEGRALRARAWLELGEFDRAAVDYRAYLHYSVERVPRAMAELGLARSLTGGGLSTPAAEAYVRAAQAFPELEPWLTIRAAESLAEYGDTAGVRRLLPRTLGVPLDRRLLADATARQRAGDRKGAIRVLLAAADSLENGSRSPDLRARIAALLLEDGDTAAARRQLRAALASGPGSPLRAAKRLSALAGLTAADHLAMARVFERSRVSGRAAQEYRNYLNLQTLPRGERQQLELKVGELLMSAGSNFAAIDQLERLLASHPNPTVSAKAEFTLARAVYRRGWRREGRERLRAVADRHPGSGSAINALALLADLYEGSGNADQARVIYAELIKRYAGSRAARKAHFRLGLTAFIDGDNGAAEAHFDRLRRIEPNAQLRLRATYWAARARLAQATIDAAAAAEPLLAQVLEGDPFGYYGFLAAKRLNVDPWLDLPAGPQPAEPDPELARNLSAIDLLREAGLLEESRAIVDQMIDSAPQSPEELLSLSAGLAERGYGYDAVRLGWRAFSRLRGEWSVSVLRAVYPFAFSEILIAESRAREVDPLLVAAIARQESAFAPEVTSRAGARGLMQVMPETGRWWASRLGIDDFSAELLYHPELNAHLGVAFIADLLQRNGELQISLVAYNAGPARARRWRRWPEYRLDSEVFAERIPFSETRHYVKTVQSQLQIYRQLYADAGAVQPTD